MITICEPEVYCAEVGETKDKTGVLDFFEKNHINDYIVVNENNNFVELIDYYSVLLREPGIKKCVENTSSAFEEARNFYSDYQNRGKLLPIIEKNGTVLSFFSWNDKLPSIKGQIEFAQEDFLIFQDFKYIVLHNCDEYNWTLLNEIIRLNIDKKVILTGIGWDVFSDVLDYAGNSIRVMSLKELEIKDAYCLICSDVDDEILNLEDNDFINGRALFDAIFQKKKVVVFLSDDWKADKKLIEKVQPLTENIEISAFVTNDKRREGEKIEGVNVYHISVLPELEYNKILVCCKIGGDENYTKKINELVLGYNIDIGQIEEFYWGIVKLKIFHNYRNTHNSDEKDLVEFLKKSYGGIWGNYLNGYKSEVWQVLWDNVSGYPYIVFEGKRMYFPYDYKNFIISNGQMYVCDLMIEQYSSSPHLYCDEEVYVKEGDVLVDAGVCEGNFALRYIDLVSKLYLIECDPMWKEPLRLTFEPYKDKVVFCDKFLTNYCDDTHVTLDELVEDKVDFLKMDIEGEEPKALMGAERLLQNKDMRLSVCTYHKVGQYEEIKNKLEESGFKTKHSNGFMLFCEDANFAKTADMRRGVIRAWK